MAFNVVKLFLKDRLQRIPRGLHAKDEDADNYDDNDESRAGKQ